MMHCEEFGSQGHPRAIPDVRSQPGVVAAGVYASRRVADISIGSEVPHASHLRVHAYQCGKQFRPLSGYACARRVRVRMPSLRLGRGQGDGGGDASGTLALIGYQEDRLREFLELLQVEERAVARQ